MAKHVPQRMCVICREMKNKSDLIRLVRQDDQVAVDPTGKKPGRGLYLCLDTETIDQLMQPKRLEKLLRGKISEENRAEVELELRRLADLKAKQEEKLNRPEVVTYDEAGRRVRRLPAKES